MAEAIVGPLLSKLKDVAVTEAQALAAVGGEIETLSDKLMWLQALVHEADLRSRHDGSRLVRVLACQIREVAFEAEDAVDEFYLKGDLSRRFALAQRFGRNWVRASVELVANFRTHFCVRFALSGRIQSMNARLEEIINNNAKYGLGDKRTPDGITWRASRAIPHMRDDWENSVPFKVVNFRSEREDEKLVKKLKEGPDGQTKVIRVVGVGGSGRRALLMHVYEEESIKNHFQVRVCVRLPAGMSDNMRIIVHEIEKKLSIIKQINKKGSKESPGRLLSVDSRCLVVIQSPISIITWSKVESELLKLKLGKGSKILLPWRKIHNENYQSIIELSPLVTEQTVTFFNYVYSNGDKLKHGTKYQTKEMDKIRDNIMGITNGLPLAVVLLAKLMRTMDLRKWGAASEYLMSSEEDTKLKTILSVSIDDLPDELKSCLLYTAGFPENRIIDAHHLVRLWMAEGFLTRQMGLEAEQLGQCYLKELIFRGLLQLISKTSGADGGRVESVAIHDQIHPLLRLEAQHTSFMDFHYGGHVPPLASTRRLALYKYNDKFSAPSICLDKLRTALSFSGDENGSTDDNKGWQTADEEKSSRKETTMMRKLLRESPFLRVVDLEGPTTETELPDEIGEMVHLQYLGVRWRLLRKVPSSIGNLGKLQTLDVRGTQVRKLPKALWMTKTLRHVLGDGLAFPRTTGELEHMQTLETVTINDTYSHTQCRPTGRRRRQSGLRFLHRLGIVQVENCKLEDLQNILMDLCYLESLSLSGNFIPMALLVGTMLSAAGARIRHVASLELDGVLLPQPNNPRDEELFHSSLPGCLANLTRLVLRRTKIKQELIHVIAKLPVLAELEMQNESYQEEELTFCDSRGFSSLTVLRLTYLDTLKTVMVHSVDSRRSKAIEPIFVDMNMTKMDKVAEPNGSDTPCSSCTRSGKAYVWQHPRQPLLSQAGNKPNAGNDQPGTSAREEDSTGVPSSSQADNIKMIVATAIALLGHMNGTNESNKTISEYTGNHYNTLRLTTDAAGLKQSEEHEDVTIKERAEPSSIGKGRTRKTNK